MHWVAVVTALILAEYVLILMAVGRARGKYGIKAPATTGNEIFERTLRVQQNTVEQLVVVVPALFLFASYVHAGLAALLGLVFLVGRGLYFQGYVASPEKRGPGFAIGALATLILVFGGVVGAVIAALRG